MLIFPLLVLAFIVYLPCLHGDFVYDDLHTTIGNGRIAEGDLHSILTMPLTSAFRHLSRASLALNVKIGGPSPFSFHVVNVALHAVNACVLSFVLTGLGATSEIATLGALLFLCHPLARDSVAYIASRAVLLSSGFALAAFAVVLHGYWPIAFPLLFLAFYSKEDSVIAAPCCGVILAMQGHWLPASAFVMPPLLVVLFMHGYIRRMLGNTETVHSAGFQTALADSGQGTIPDAWICAMTSFTATILRFPAWCFGYGQNFDHDVARPTRWEVGTALAFCAGFLVVFVASSASVRIALTMIALSPAVIYWCIPLRDAIYEYRFYLPLAAFCIAASLVFTPMPAVLYAVIPLFAMQSFSRARDFWHPTGVWLGAVRDGSDCKVRVLTNLGVAYQVCGDEANARLWYTRALEINPHNAPASVNLALIEARVGNFPKSQEILLSVTARAPKFALAWHALKAVCTAMKDLKHIPACDERIAALGGS